MIFGKRTSILDRLLSTPVSVLFIILTLVCVSYSNSLKSPLVLDDSSSFVEVQKVYINDFSLESLQQLSTTRFGNARLLPLVSFALDHKIGNESVVQFHLTNLIIHLLATVALYVFLQSLVQTPKVRQSTAFMAPPHFCLFVTALWALHPVQTNAVTYIVQRMTSMTAMFYFSSVAFYVHARLCRAGFYRYVLYAGCLFSAMCAFQSKENSATLPAAVLLVEMIFITPDLGRRIISFLKWRHLVLIFLLVIVLLPLGIKPWHEIMSDYGMRHFSMTERFLTELRIVVFYLSLLALPLPSLMNLDHDFALSGSLLSPPTTLLSGLAIVFLLVWAFRVRKTQALLAFGIFWFFLNLLIESTIIPLELIFEHRLYLPSAGFFIVVILLLDRCCSSVSKFDRVELQRIVFLSVAIVAVILSILTSARNYVWRDTLSLYGDCVRKSPDKPRALSNYGLALSEDGQYQESIVWFEKAIAKGRPNYEEYLRAANNIMVSLHALKKYDEAVRRGEEYLSKVTADLNGEGFPKFLYNLGVSYTMVGRYKDALSAFNKGIRLKRPDTPYLIYGMEVSLAKAMGSEDGRRELELGGNSVDIPLRMAFYMIQLREYDFAGIFVERAKAAEPENELLLKIKDIYDQDLEKSTRAEQLADIRNDPPYNRNRLFRFYLRLADFILGNYPFFSSQAGKIIDRAGELEPSDPFVALYRARWLLKTDRLDSALEVLENAILENPDFPPGLELAGSCYMNSGQPENAAIVFQHLLNIYPGHKSWGYYEDVISRYNKAEMQQ